MPLTFALSVTVMNWMVSVPLAAVLEELADVGLLEYVRPYLKAKGRSSQRRPG